MLGITAVFNIYQVQDFTNFDLFRINSSTYFLLKIRVIILCLSDKVISTIQLCLNE